MDGYTRSQKTRGSFLTNLEMLQIGLKDLSLSKYKLREKAICMSSRSVPLTKRRNNEHCHLPS